MGRGGEAEGGERRREGRGSADAHPRRGRSPAAAAGADGAGAARRTVPLARGPAVLVAAGARLVLDALPVAGPDAAAGPGPALIFVASVHGSFE